MSPVPERPKIFHITHVDNLLAMIEAKGIWSDRQRLRQNLNCTSVGMASIKNRRLNRISVPCHPGTKVGDYVPFYFCPRSIMLFTLSRGNHPGLSYHGGQQPIVHLQADLLEVVKTATELGIPWAFSNANAGTLYAEFHDSLDRLSNLNWEAIMTHDFRQPITKEGKQAEFLWHDFFPWHLIEKIGILDILMLKKVEKILCLAEHQPELAQERGWYF